MCRTWANVYTCNHEVHFHTEPCYFHVKINQPSIPPKEPLELLWLENECAKITVRKKRHLKLECEECDADTFAANALLDAQARVIIADLVEGTAASSFFIPEMKERK